VRVRPSELYSGKWTPHCDWAPTHGKLVRYVEQCRLFAGADKRGPMRASVDPPPSLRCDLCTGELRLKKIEQHTSPLESDTTTFVCAKCGHEIGGLLHRSSYTIWHPYMRHLN
jgi:hypothetical protein